MSRAGKAGRRRALPPSADRPRRDTAFAALHEAVPAGTETETLRGAGLQLTGNGQSHEVALHALATGQATQVEAHCRRCGATLTASAADGIGPKCATKAVA